MLPPAVDALYDAFKHPRAERPSLPLLPPVEARANDHEVRGRVLDLIEHTPADELFTAGRGLPNQGKQGAHGGGAAAQQEAGPDNPARTPPPPSRPLSWRRA